MGFINNLITGGPHLVGAQIVDAHNHPRAGTWKVYEGYTMCKLCFRHHLINLTPKRQWPFEAPKLEALTIRSILCKGIYPKQIVLYCTVPPDEALFQRP